jgi:hypothetical protein
LSNAALSTGASFGDDSRKAAPAGIASNACREHQ